MGRYDRRVRFLVAAWLASVCACGGVDAARTISFGGDVPPDCDLGIYKTGADGVTALAISGGQGVSDVSIDGIDVPAPYIAVADPDARIKRITAVAAVPSRDGGLHAHAIARDATGGVAVLWGIDGSPNTLVRYRADSASPEWSLGATGSDVVLAVSRTGEVAYIEHDSDETGFHERARLIAADGTLRWTRELPDYARCVWFAPSHTSARGVAVPEDVMVFSYSFGELELAAADGSVLRSGSAPACPAGALPSLYIYGRSLTLDR